jgi:phosphatidylethanolamine N-methyltransferase
MADLDLGTRRVSNVSNLDPAQYAVSLRQPGPYHLGQPIEVEWVAPSKHSRSDWIGIYPVRANASSQVTTVSSKKRWSGVYPDEWSGDVHIATSQAPDIKASSANSVNGAVCFESTERLPNTVGTYELRWVTLADAPLADKLTGLKISPRWQTQCPGDKLSFPDCW